MNQQPYMPEPGVDRRLLANLRRSRWEMEELGLQLEEVITKLAQHNRQQRLKRVRQLLNAEATESQPPEQNSSEVLS